MTLQVPAGAVCAKHTTAASAVCSRCGAFACEACVFAKADGIPTCRACASKGLAAPIPLERMAELGFVQAVWQTVKVFSFDPVTAFRTPRSGTMVSPVIFAVSIWTVASAVHTGIFAVLYAALLGVMPMGLGNSEKSMVIGMFTGSMILPILFFPFFAAIALFVQAGATHLVLMMFGSEKNGFAATLRAQSYANVGHIANAIPIVGPLISLIWVWVLDVLGTREAHETSTGMAFVAASCLRLLGCGITCAGFVAFAALIEQFVKQ